MLTEGEGFYDWPLGGHAGEMLPQAPPEPQAPGAGGDPPPDWEAELEAGLAQVASPPEQPVSALDVIKSVDEPYHPPAPGRRW